jgi:hypothetical protein
MSDRFLDGPAFLCALIPACVSFTIASFALLHTFLFTEKLTFLRRLDVLFCVAEMVQCGSWFFGPKYTSSRVVCALQEYFFQAGLLLKCAICVINIALMSYVVHKRCMPTYDIVKIPIFAIFGLAGLSLLLSIALDSSEVICTGELSDPSKSNGAHVYGFCFMLPVLLCALSSVVLSTPSLRSIGDDLGAPSLRSLVDKARAYFALLLFVLLPSLVFFTVLKFTDHFNNVLFCIMQVAIHTGGALTCLSFVLFPFHNKRRQLNYYFVSQYFDSSTLSSSMMTDRGSAMNRQSSSSAVVGGLGDPLTS